MVLNIINNGNLRYPFRVGRYDISLPAMLIASHKIMDEWRLIALLWLISPCDRRVASHACKAFKCHQPVLLAPLLSLAHRLLNLRG
jgi:hypothetical protein